MDEQLLQQAQSLDSAHRIIGQLYTQLIDLSNHVQNLQGQVAVLSQPSPAPTITEPVEEGSNNPAIVDEPT